jgi:hypothetical protein
LTLLDACQIITIDSQFGGVACQPGNDDDSRIPGLDVDVHLTVIGFVQFHSDNLYIAIRIGEEHAHREGLRQNIVMPYPSLRFPLCVLCFGIVAPVNFRNADVIHPHPRLIHRIVGDELEAQENLLTGIGAQVDGFMQPAIAIRIELVAALTGVAAAVSIAMRIAGGLIAVTTVTPH